MHNSYRSVYSQRTTTKREEYGVQSTWVVRQEDVIQAGWERGGTSLHVSNTGRLEQRNVHHALMKSTTCIYLVRHTYIRRMNIQEKNHPSRTILSHSLTEASFLPSAPAPSSGSTASVAAASACLGTGTTCTKQNEKPEFHSLVYVSMPAEGITLIQ